MLRFLAVASIVVGGGMLAYSWVSPRNYTPIRPGEKGTLLETVRAVKDPSDLPKAETPAEAPPPEATTTTTAVEPEVTTTVARRRTATTVAEEEVTTTTEEVTTTRPAPTTTRVSPTTTAP